MLTCCHIEIGVPSSSHSILTPGQPVFGMDSTMPGAWQDSHNSIILEFIGVSTKTICDYLYGWIFKKMVTYAKKLTKKGESQSYNWKRRRRRGSYWYVSPPPPPPPPFPPGKRGATPGSPALKVNTLSLGHQGGSMHTKGSKLWKAQSQNNNGISEYQP